MGKHFSNAREGIVIGRCGRAVLVELRQSFDSRCLILDKVCFRMVLIPCSYLMHRVTGVAIGVVVDEFFLLVGLILDLGAVGIGPVHAVGSFSPCLPTLDQSLGRRLVFRRGIVPA